ncbi:MAG: glycogen debranching enzyme GlgX, partial [Planctomycetaceae bacterium]
MTNYAFANLLALPANNTPFRVWRGRPAPLGATWDGAGVNFAVASEFATGVLVCLFDSPESQQETARIPLREHTDGVWHGYIPGLAPGQLYGLRVLGPWEPSAGHRYNASKILLDPWARAIGRGIGWSDAMFGYQVGADDLTRDDRDNAWCAPLAAVNHNQFDWGDDRPPGTPWHRTLIYETHVKGQTRLHPGVPEPIRGTYAGLASRASIEHLQRVGVTAVELLPVHAHVDDRNLVTHGLRNYW